MESLQTTPHQEDEYLDPAHKDEGPDVEERPDDVPAPTPTPPAEEEASQPDSTGNTDPAEGETYVGDESSVVVNENEQTEDEYLDPAHKDEGPDVEERPDDVPAPTPTPPAEEEIHPTTDTAPATDETEIINQDSGGTEIIEGGGVIVSRDDTSEAETTTTEIQPEHDNLADTGGGDLTALGVAGSAALILGAGAAAFKRRRNRRPQ